MHIPNLDPVTLILSLTLYLLTQYPLNLGGINETQKSIVQKVSSEFQEQR